MRLCIAIISFLALMGIAEDARPEIRIAQYVEGGNARGLLWSSYPGALSSLLKHVSTECKCNIVPEPAVIGDFTDSRLADYPFIYINAADCREWSFSEEAIAKLRDYLENGGFIFIDAGITASFLREHPELAASHSYAEWEASPEIKTLFEKVLPGNPFMPLDRKHPLFSIYYKGLPDTAKLPDTVRDYVEKEKWPEGTYSAVAIRLNGRMAVLCTPIIAMGWARNELGQWKTNIQFRVLEQTEGLDQVLKNAAYSGAKFEVVREDGGKDIVYCQKEALPAWCMEPGGRWRVFRYYASREISDYTHEFYTRLGTNIILYAILQ